MAKITAAEVNKLRKQTGAGMMDCKKALVECDGNFEKAIEHLRKKGAKVAAKRADKEASEGYVIAKTNEEKNFGTILMVNCETDFVAKNESFVNFVTRLSDIAITLKPANLDALKVSDMNGFTVDQTLTELIGKTGEKMTLAAYEFIEAPRVAAYNHQGNRLATLLGMNKTDVENIDEIGHEIAMQIAAMNPLALDKDDISQEVIDKELEIGKELARREGKPEKILDKIAMGRLGKFFKENTLLNQDFIRDTKKTVGQYIKEVDKDLTITKFFRLMLGA